MTLYDLVSEIVGDVGDAEDRAAPNILHSPDGSAVINGLTSIGDVNEAFGLNLVDLNYDTLGGFVMGRLGRIPKVGDEFELKAEGIRMRVEEMDHRRVARVRLTRAQTPPLDSSAAADDISSSTQGHPA